MNDPWADAREAAEVEQHRTGYGRARRFRSRGQWLDDLKELARIWAFIGLCVVVIVFVAGCAALIMELR